MDYIIYRCTECHEKFIQDQEYDKILKAPCPNCETCTIEHYKGFEKTIQSDTKAKDIIDDITEKDAR